VSNIMSKLGYGINWTGGRFWQTKHVGENAKNRNIPGKRETKTEIGERGGDFVPLGAQMTGGAFRTPSRRESDRALKVALLVHERPRVGDSHENEPLVKSKATVVWTRERQG